MGQYLTNLTDKRWQFTENILDPKHRKRKFNLRDIMDAIMYLVTNRSQRIILDEVPIVGKTPDGGLMHIEFSFLYEKTVKE